MLTTYYQDISLSPKARIGLYDFWQKLYQQIHLALVENKSGQNVSKIGVSFPEYSIDELTLGTKLRLFAEEERLLEDLQCEKWLECLCDYVYVTPITLVPKKVEGYACFRHLRIKGSKEKMARRRAKRNNETFEQALAHFSGYKEQRTKLPYVNITSQTNGQRFRLIIEKQSKEQSQSGHFSCYGLSNTTTIPIF